MNIIYFLLLGAVAGWIAGQLSKGSGFGLIGNIVVGIVGAVVGGFVFSLLGIGAENLIGQLIVAVIGAVIFLAILGFVMRKK